MRSPLQRCSKLTEKFVECYQVITLQISSMVIDITAYVGPVSRFTTPIDKEHTVILGLEMEFEGDFMAGKNSKTPTRATCIMGMIVPLMVRTN